MIRTVLNKNVGFNNSDKHFGPVLYSQKHLFHGKGTYEYTERPKDLILEVTRRLKNLLHDCFGKESTTNLNKTPCTDTHEMGR
jgi:hypothetical protein